MAVIETRVLKRDFRLMKKEKKVRSGVVKSSNQ